MIFKKPIINNNESENNKLSADCLDCNWSGKINETETDYCGDYDEFKGMHIPTPIYPKCGGGVDIN